MPKYVCIHCDFKTVSRDEIEDHEKAHEIDRIMEESREINHE